MWACKQWYFCTALKYWEAYKKKKLVAAKTNNYYRIHRSKSNRKLVTGGRKLKQSGVYTKGFCNACVKMFDCAQKANFKGFSDYASFIARRKSYEILWCEVLACTTVEKDSFWLKLVGSQKVISRIVFSYLGDAAPNRSFGI